MTTLALNPPEFPVPTGVTASTSGKWLVPGALAATAIAAIARGAKVQDEQEARMLDLSNARQHDMTAALPKMTVKQSHEEFARRKLAALGDGQPLQFAAAAPKFQDVATSALANAVADIGIKRPFNALQSVLKKKLYTEPKQRRVFEQVLGMDPELARLHRENPEMIARLHSSLKSYAPSLAMDPLITQNFLNQSATIGGQLDFATAKSLAEIERTVRQARGEIGGM